MASSTEEGGLVEIPPGRYLIEGDSSDIFFRCDKPTLGLVIGMQQDSGKTMSSVLVEGKVILLWGRFVPYPKTSATESRKH